MSFHCELLTKPNTELFGKERCTLQNVQWHSLIHGTRDPFVDCSAVEKERRLAEAKTLLHHLLGQTSWEACMKILLDSPSSAGLLINAAKQLRTDGAVFSPPSLEALLKFKQAALIPDSEWKLVMDTFNLGPESSLAQVKKLRKVWSDELEPSRSPGGRGHQIDILTFLQYLLAKNPPTDPTQPVRVKFAFDGAKMTSGARIPAEIGTIDILTGVSLKQAKSPENAHQWLIFIGDEEYSNMAEELADALPTLKYLADGNTVCWLVSQFNQITLNR